MSDYLPEAILIEILVKLPVKSLIRATSVCKPWWSLIRSSSFISAHLSVTENQALLRHCDFDDDREHYIVIPKGGPFGINPSPELQLPFKCPIGFFRIVGSCDGLLCLFNDERFSNDGNLVKSLGPILIWNPAIRNHVVLPQPLHLVNLNKFDRVALGFGVSRNVYKVVRLVCCINRYPLQAEILSLGTGKWRNLCLPKFDRRLCLFGYRGRPVFLKGFVHWSTYDASRNSILTFHVGDEVFGEFVLPGKLERDALTSLSLAVMGESLVAVKFSWGPCGRRYNVWMMKDYGVKESWTKLYSIDSRGVYGVIGFWGRGEALAIHEYELVTYNAETKGIEYVGFSGNKWAHYVDDYRESLVLLGGYSGDSGEELSRDAARIIES